MILTMAIKNFVNFIPVALTLGLIISGCPQQQSATTADQQAIPAVGPYTPEEYKGFLKTPGIGFQTFYRFEDEDVNLQKMPFRSGSAYFRWMWSQIEPEEGNYNWSLIDGHLARARENGQTLEFRIMLEHPGEYDIGIPRWLVDKEVKMRLSNCEGHEYYSPDLDDPVLKAYHEKLIRALGNRYDGHPDLGSVDIGSVGLWGEWHEYCNRELMPSEEERLAIIDLYYESFPNTPLVALVNDKRSMKYAAEKGRTAWRGDCWGNYPADGQGWNHHLKSYRPAHYLIPKAWQNGPVALESCYTMKKWHADGYAITEIIDDAIDWHASLVHNKSDYIPQEYKSEVERLVMKLGFRIVLRAIDFAGTVHSADDLPVAMKWENVGIAPPYRDYRIALRLSDDQDKIYGQYISDKSIRGWLPGTISEKVRYPLPGDLSMGKYQVQLGLVFHSAPDRVVPIANEGKTNDGWYSVGSINIE